MAEPLELTDANFEDAINSAQPTLVDFWAEWCQPCKMIAPLIDELANELDGKLSVGKLNIDNNEQTPQKYGIRGIPTFMLFKEGNLVATKVGSLTKSQLMTFVESNL